MQVAVTESIESIESITSLTPPASERITKVWSDWIPLFELKVSVKLDRIIGANFKGPM